MIYSLKCTGDNLFSLKINLSKIILHLSFPTNLPFYFFFFFGEKIWVCLDDIILFSSDLYSSNFCIVCYVFFFFLQLKLFLCFKLII